MNLSTKQKQTHIQNRLVVVKGRGEGDAGNRVGKDWELGLAGVSYYI